MAATGAAAAGDWNWKARPLHDYMRSRQFKVWSDKEDQPDVVQMQREAIDEARFVVGPQDVVGVYDAPRSRATDTHDETAQYRQDDTGQSVDPYAANVFHDDHGEVGGDGHGRGHGDDDDKANVDGGYGGSNGEQGGAGARRDTTTKFDEQADVYSFIRKGGVLVQNLDPLTEHRATQALHNFLLTHYRYLSFNLTTWRDLIFILHDMGPRYNVELRKGKHLCYLPAEFKPAQLFRTLRNNVPFSWPADPILHPMPPFLDPQEEQQQRQRREEEQYYSSATMAPDEDEDTEWKRARRRPRRRRS